MNTIEEASASKRARRMIRALCTLFAALLALSELGVVSVYAQPSDPNFAHPNQVVTVAADGHTMSGLATHLKQATKLKYGVALFPGHPGIMRLMEENGQPSFTLGGNFLVRSRRHWLDEETLVLILDAPSDQWSSFSQAFRETARYGKDVEALVTEAGRRFGVEDWTFVGTSEGSVSAFHAARMNPNLARRTILTSSVFLASRNGPGLSNVSWGELRMPLLWVHHEDDPCRYTPYSSAHRFAEMTRSPLMTVRGGGPARGEPCMARTAHGFIGIERETVLAMRSWIKTGAIPPDVTRQGAHFGFAPSIASARGTDVQVRNAGNQ